MYIKISWEDIKKSISRLFKKSKSSISVSRTDPYEKVEEYLNKNTLPDYGAFFIWDNGTDNDRIDLIKRIYREGRYTLIYNLIKRKPRMVEYKDIYKICKELDIISEDLNGSFEVKHSSNKVKEYLFKKHISVMEIGHIWKNGDDFDRITLLNRLYDEYEDYDMIINLINKKPSMLDYPEIKKMYEHIAKLEDMEKNEELIKGWRS